MKIVRIIDMSYQPPRTVGIRYNVKGELQAHTVTVPIEKLQPASYVFDIIESDYAARQKDPNQERFREFIEKYVGTEFEFDDTIQDDSSQLSIDVTKHCNGQQHQCPECGSKLN